MSGRIALREELTHHARRQADRANSVRRAVVTAIAPITVQFFDSDIVLTEDNDFWLSQWATSYNTMVGIDMDDVVLLHEQEDWVLFDVISDKTKELSGDLSGSLPDPTVPTVRGGKVPVARGDTMGGDLTGTMPDPHVATVLNGQQPMVSDATGFKLYGPYTATSGSLAPQAQSAAAVVVSGLAINESATAAYLLDAGMVDAGSGFSNCLSWSHTGINLTTQSDSFVFLNNAPTGGNTADGVLTFYVLANA